MLYKDAYERGHEPYDGMHAALLADTAGNSKERDALLAAIADNKAVNSAPNRVTYVQIAGLMRNALAKGAGDPHALDLKQADAIVQKLGSGEPTNWWYFLAHSYRTGEMWRNLVNT